MNLSPIAALGGLTLAGLVQVGGLLIWGASLSQRVRRLEEELGPLRALPERFARVEVRLDGLFERLSDIASSIRRLGEPAGQP